MPSRRLKWLELSAELVPYIVYDGAVMGIVREGLADRGGYMDGGGGRFRAIMRL